LAEAASVTVLIPNFNHGRYLEGTLSAFLGQTLPPAQIVVVDDGSTDESWSVLEAMAERDRSITLVRRPERGGVNAALEDGMGRATGDLIATCAADDLFLPHYLERSVAALQRYPQAAFSFGEPAEVTEDGAQRRHFTLGLADRETYLSPEAFRRHLRRAAFTVSGNTVVYRRAMLESIGGYRTDLRWHADWFAKWALAFRHGAVYVPEVVSYFRLSPTSYSATSLSRMDGRREVIQLFLDLIADGPFADLQDSFRHSALLPEYRPYVLPLLLRSAAGLAVMSPRLVGRIATRTAWGAVRPLVGAPLRRALRKMLS
jgi:glycosyltransferase involved in cell wall biosynthesis